ncbi:hypothetical protein STEG23_034123 [Scotinomys teguina]
MCRLSWFLDPGGWSKTATVGLYFIFPGICTLSLVSVPQINPFLLQGVVINNFRYGGSCKEALRSEIPKVIDDKQEPQEDVDAARMKCGPPNPQRQ